MSEARAALLGFIAWALILAGVVITVLWVTQGAEQKYVTVDCDDKTDIYLCDDEGS